MAHLYFLGNTTKFQMFGCVIQTETKTLVIDGGTDGDSEQLATLLLENAHSHVDAWFFTHPHHDHIGAFVRMCESHPEITIDTVYFHFPPLSLLKGQAYRPDFEECLWEIYYSLPDVRTDIVFQQVNKNDQFIFDGVRMTVLRVFNPSIQQNLVNNSSCVYRLDGPNKSVLFLGDLGIEGGEDTIEQCPAEILHTDYTQMAHHGQAGVSREFYEYIRPQRCLWPTPVWLWNNDNGGGYDSGPWQTLHTRAWMEELGVIEHIIEKDGTTRIEL